MGDLDELLREQDLFQDAPSPPREAEVAPPLAAPAPGTEQALVEDLCAPTDATGDLQFMQRDGPRVHGRGNHGRYVYSFTFAHPGPESVARGLCSPGTGTHFEKKGFGSLAYLA